MNRQDDKISDQMVITEMTDASGNTSEIKVKKKLSKRDEKAMLKVPLAFLYFFLLFFNVSFSQLLILLPLLFSFPRRFLPRRSRMAKS